MFKFSRSSILKFQFSKTETRTIYSNFQLPCFVCAVGGQWRIRWWLGHKINIWHFACTTGEAWRYHSPPSLSKSDEILKDWSLEPIIYKPKSFWKNGFTVFPIIAFTYILQILQVWFINNRTYADDQRIAKQNEIDQFNNLGELHLQASPMTKTQITSTKRYQFYTKAILPFKIKILLILRFYWWLTKGNTNWHNESKLQIRKH